MIKLTPELLEELGWKVAWALKRMFEREIFDPEDIAQEARMGMLQSARTYGPFESKGIAFETGRRKAIDLFRRTYGRNCHKPWRVVPGGTPLQDYYFPTKPSYDPEPYFINQEYIAWVCRHLDEETLEMLDRWVEGQEAQQIKEEMGVGSNVYWVKKTLVHKETRALEVWENLRRLPPDQLNQMRREWSIRRARQTGEKTITRGGYPDYLTPFSEERTGLRRDRESPIKVA